MADYLEVPAEILSLAVPENIVIGSNAPLDLKLGRLRQQQKKGRTDLRQLESHLDGLYRRAVSELVDTPPSVLVQVADILLQKERAAAEVLLPGIEKLRQNLASRPDLKGSDVEDTLQEGLRIAERWLSLYSGTRARILALAEGRNEPFKGILRAKPVKGEVDHEALTREFMARFPKLRAALAK
jgi:hypothetical protein